MYVIRRSDGAFFTGYTRIPGLHASLEPRFKKPKPGKPVAAYVFELRLEAQDEIINIGKYDKRACVAAYIQD